MFVYDGGVLASDTDFTLPVGELGSHRFVAPADLEALTVPRLANRIRAALHARATATTVELDNGAASSSLREPALLSARGRVPFDGASYTRRSRSDTCFVCNVIAGTHDQPVHLIHRDELVIAFLAGYPRLPVLRGYVILAPVEHREHVVRDFTKAEYLALQDTAYSVARAVESVVPTERLYLLSLGSQQGNSHVHWHLAPLPPGVPYTQQQFHPLMPEHAGLLDVSDADQAALAARIAAAMAALPQEGSAG